MKYAIYLPNASEFADLRLLVDLAVEAETGGWHGVFIRTCELCSVSAYNLM